MLSIKLAGLQEAETLHGIQKQAFEEELISYQDFDTNPACESLERLAYKINAHDYYAIFFHDKIIGGAAVQKRAEYEYRISPIYLLPSYQNKGLGTHILHSLFAFYPDARLWSLDTPKRNARNGHFYEKFGFISVGEHYINERLTLTRYQKVIK